MKRFHVVLLFSILAFLPHLSQAQEVKQMKSLEAQDYRMKSRNFRTAGWITLGVGAATMYAGLFVAVHEISSGTGTAELPAYMILSGALVAGSSIPLFVAAKVNSNKARELSMRIQFDRSAPLPARGMAPVYYPAIAVRWTIR